MPKVMAVDNMGKSHDEPIGTLPGTFLWGELASECLGAGYLRSSRKVTAAIKKTLGRCDLG